MTGAIPPVPMTAAVAAVAAVTAVATPFSLAASLVVFQTALPVFLVVSQAASFVFLVAFQAAEAVEGAASRTLSIFRLMLCVSCFSPAVRVAPVKLFFTAATPSSWSPSLIRDSISLLRAPCTSPTFPRNFFANLPSEGLSPSPGLPPFIKLLLLL